MASNTSKTARASVRAGQAGAAGGALSVLGEFKYLIPLTNGKLAYVRNLTNGKTEHLRPTPTRSSRRSACWPPPVTRRRSAPSWRRSTPPNPEHGWDATEKRLVDAGVFEG